MIGRRGAWVQRVGGGKVDLCPLLLVHGCMIVYGISYPVTVHKSLNLVFLEHCIVQYDTDLVSVFCQPLPSSCTCRKQKTT
ncbi:hypothetical protein HOY80DRAFT_944725 [Tuber brumale]|nr:hypothetical protein HOY80DRAFT_944725 [Tuber brumale]